MHAKISNPTSQMQMKEKTAVFGLQPFFFYLHCQMCIERHSEISQFRISFLPLLGSAILSSGLLNNKANSLTKRQKKIQQSLYCVQLMTQSDP